MSFPPHTLTFASKGRGRSITTRCTRASADAEAASVKARRLAARERDGDCVRLITRGGYDWTKRFPWIADTALKNPAYTRGSQTVKLSQRC